ncbi:Tetratricopeptide-like helical domain-containing protein [Dioscorea alata]|uniref:Tetratricopeptide-like helical domain-containing protein n=2 Tax=Dioscorea alata TaxID=55571 RepID=A0ACB7UZ82_DIOAL|nr:Tetratricopeptide-like helical domain-containing protein [Dioscorea alata]KAH7666163.1 Tetratricopeptide-like helical domain-containing protein [Dioscorea alata]
MFLQAAKNLWDPTISLILNHPTLLLLEKCSNNAHFKQILAQMFRHHLLFKTFPMSRLLYFSAIAHPCLLNHALLLFHHFTFNPNLFIFNTMISALSFSVTQSVAFYKSMLHLCVCPDEHTLISLLKSSRKDLSLGKQIHAQVIIFGFSFHAYVHNSLVKMYLENGEIGVVEKLVRPCGDKKDIVLFNTLMSWYVKKGCYLDALEVFDELMGSGVEPDQYTIVSLLVCCGQLNQVLVGKSVHGWVVRRMGYQGWGLVLCNALLDMYVKCEEMGTAMKIFYRISEKDSVSWNIMVMGFNNVGEFDLAYKAFEEMPDKDLVSWNSLLSGYLQKGNYKRVIELFHFMLSQNDVKPDKVTAVTLIGAAAEMGVLDQGRVAHGWVSKLFGISDAFVGSAVIDMYCKCGSIERARVVFEMVSERDITLWTAMMSGLALHGHGTKALELFWDMQREGLLPNNVTLLAALTACAHGGLVDQGVRIFQSMKHVYGIAPGVEHYGCLVDVLTRSGRLMEAMNVIQMMPVKPSSSIWGSVLSAAKTCRNMKLAEDALKELVKLEPEEEGGYILLSNVYAACRRWTYSGKIRGVMETKGAKKLPGCSSVVVDGLVHYFFSSDKRHTRWPDIYIMLCNLHREMSSGEVLLMFSNQLEQSAVH